MVKVVTLFGFFIPEAGGDPIPLVKDAILIGRRPECDIRVPEVNISGKHCELRRDSKGWVVVDLKSANGTKVNGVKIQKKRLSTGDQITLARKHLYRIEFDPKALELAASAAPEAGDSEFTIDIGTDDQHEFKESLLKRAGLEHKALNDVDGEYIPAPPEPKPARRSDAKADKRLEKRSSPRPDGKKERRRPPE
jgi:adenylate cyclase